MKKNTNNYGVTVDKVFEALANPRVKVRAVKFYDSGVIRGTNALEEVVTYSFSKGKWRGNVSVFDAYGNKVCDYKGEEYGMYAFVKIVAKRLVGGKAEATKFVTVNNKA